jgi:O-succinylbenzoate synthase
MRPPLDDLLDRMHVVAVPMRVRFRGITIREGALFDGPVGWGEFGAFLEYEPPEAAHWLASGIESAFGTKPVARRDRIPINASCTARNSGRATLQHIPWCCRVSEYKR